MQYERNKDNKYKKLATTLWLVFLYFLIYSLRENFRSRMRRWWYVCIISLV